jgi:hypothetical protein
MDVAKLQVLKSQMLRSLARFQEHCEYVTIITFPSHNLTSLPIVSATNGDILNSDHGQRQPRLQRQKPE